MGNLFKATVYVAAINLLGLALNFLLNLVLASKFGVGTEIDCYLAATAAPTYIITILTGSLSVTFIPAFIDKKNDTGKWELMTSILVLLVAVGAILSMLIFIFSFQLIELQTPGFTGELREYSSFLLRCYVVVLFLTVINEVFSGVFYSNNEFVIPMINRLISPVITISIIYAMGADSDATTIVWCSVIGVLIQTIILLYSFFRRGHRIKLGGKLFSSEVRVVLRLMTPLLIGSVFYKSLPVIDKYFLSSLPSGSISVINYAQKLFFAAIQILGAALSMQVLAHMSHLASESNYSELSKTLNMLVRLVLFVTIPVTGVCFLFGEEITRLIYERGHFTSINTREVLDNFRIYAFAIPGALLGTVVSQGLYVMKDTWSPFYVGLAEVALYMVLCFTLIDSLGIIALPISYVAYFYFSLLILGFILSRKIKFLRWKELGLLVFKFGALIALELILINFLLNGYSLSNLEAIIIISISMLFYLLISFLLKYQEVQFILNRILLEKNKFLNNLK